MLKTNTNLKLYENGLFFLSLGGIGEIGANCYLYCWGEVMNKHIKLVKKWLDDLDSVTQEELDLNADAANAAFWAADASDAAAYAAAYGDAELAADWVKKYEEMINE